MSELVYHLFTTSAYIEIFAATVLYFTFLYFLCAFAGAFVSKRVLPKLNIGHKISERKVESKQVRYEIKLSLISILVFGVYGVLPRWLYDIGLVHISWQTSATTFALELLAVFLWNDLHFYASHWVLHRKWFFKKVHILHHHSHVPTTFSTYSFHWFEALLLGSVMIIPMFFYSFSYVTLLCLPVMSIVLNTLGHWNYDAFPSQKRGLLKFSNRHSLHHRKVNGNYGFFLNVFDWLFKTELEDRS